MGVFLMFPSLGIAAITKTTAKNLMKIIPEQDTNNLALMETPESFVKYFNKTIPGIWRQLTIEDVRKLTEFRLVKVYGYFSQSRDLEIVRAILTFEDWRRSQQPQPGKEENKVVQEPLCKLCGKSFPRSEKQTGRHHEYCSDCQKNRANMRWRKHIKNAANRNANRNQGAL